MEEAFIGSILLFPYNFTPRAFHECDGSFLKIAENQALFSLIGTNFGGDGHVTFAVPNMNKADDPVLQNGKLHYCIAINGIYPQRN